MGLHKTFTRNVNSELTAPLGRPPLTTSTTTPPAETIPNTSQGDFDAGYLGQHQRYTEHAGALNYIVMGARTYDPRTGRFLQTDPVEGGGPNDYSYPTDPVNMLDLDGELWWIVAHVVVKVVVKYAPKIIKSVSKAVNKGKSAAVKAGTKVADKAAKSPKIGYNSPKLKPGNKLNSGPHRVGWSQSKYGNYAAFRYGGKGKRGGRAFHVTLMKTSIKWNSRNK